MLLFFVDVNLLKRGFKNLRDRFMKMRREYTPSGSAGGVPIEPTWPYYKQLSYLAPFMKHRLTKSNLPEMGESSEHSSVDQFPTIEHENLSALFPPDEEIDNSLSSISALSPAPSIIHVDSPSPTPHVLSPIPTPSSLDGSQPAKKQKRCQRKNDGNSSDDPLLKALQESNDFISMARQKAEPDEDDLFGQSIGKQLKNFNEYQRSLAKLKIQQVMYEVRWEHDPNH